MVLTFHEFILMTVVIIHKDLLLSIQVRLIPISTRKETEIKFRARSQYEAPRALKFWEHAPEPVDKEDAVNNDNGCNQERATARG